MYRIHNMYRLKYKSREDETKLHGQIVNIDYCDLASYLHDVVTEHVQDMQVLS